MPARIVIGPRPCGVRMLAVDHLGCLVPHHHLHCVVLCFSTIIAVYRRSVGSKGMPLDAIRYRTQSLGFTERARQKQ
jgi:hypothetical protein